MASRIQIAYRVASSRAAPAPNEILYQSPPVSSVTPAGDNVPEHRSAPVGLDVPPSVAFIETVNVPGEPDLNSFSLTAQIV